MAARKLILNAIFEDVDCTLIAIYSSVEAYRLAYLLNKYLSINLTRRKLDLDVGIKNVSYPIFEWEDSKELLTWSLVANSCKTETSKQINYNSLFVSEEKVTKIFYLVPEYKAVNFFLKIDNQTNLNKEKQILKTILDIQQVKTANCIDINQLKSKDNLIFS